MLEKLKELFDLENLTGPELTDYIIIYLRKSRKDAEYSKDEPIEKTLERHEKQLQEWSTNILGCKIPEKNIYREVVSGDTITDRPEMQKVLELIEKDEIKGVLCVETERLGRGNSIDQGIIAQKFQLTGTKILTPQKIFDLDDEYDMSYFEDGLHQARKYLQYTKKILARGREQSAKEGKFTGSVTPFGYDKQKIKDDKGYVLIKNSDSEIVRKLFDIYLYENLGTTETAKKLNSLEMHCATGGKWDDNKVRRILQAADRYCGYITWGKRKIRKKYVDGEVKITRPINENCINVKGKHEAIITEEELKMVKTKLKNMASKNVTNDKELKNPLANIVKCGFCGHNMSRRAYYTSSVKNGTIHKDTLLCRTGDCPNISCDLDIVENKILEYLKIKLNDYEYYLKDYNIQSKDFISEYKKEKEQLNKKRNSLNSQKQKCCEFLETGTYDEETFKIRIGNINNEIKSIDNMILELDEKIKNEKKEKYIKSVPILKNCLELYDKSSIEQKNKLLSSIIDVVYYKKTSKGGRWNTEARSDFELEIKLKI
ncbi:MAG: recombinase family protein [Ruminococcus sp.]|nr:recombinase family protein [Ruminococcus sp.]